eukprot:1890762-Pleurochrysis_carterae.AAC.1
MGRARTRLLPCVPTSLGSASGTPDPLPLPPNGASLSNATDGEAAKTASISASTPCACFSSRCP